MLTILIAAALMVSPSATTRKSEADFMCSVKLPAIDGAEIASYTLYTSANRKPLERHLHLRTGAFTVFWNHDQGLRSEASMGWFDAWFPVPQTAAFPVTMQLKADGKALASIRAWRSHNKSEAGSALFMSIKVPNIFGARQMSANVTDSAGRKIGAREFALPNWAWLEREARIAGRTADDLSRRDKCQPALHI